LLLSEHLPLLTQEVSLTGAQVVTNENSDVLSLWVLSAVITALIALRLLDSEWVVLD
jgi:hypothetical protein